MLETQEKLKFVRERVPLEADEPTTLVEVYERVARTHPKPDTLNYKRDGAWHSISAGEMLRRSRWIALGLYSLGVRKDDRVALLSESRVEWVLADQGCIFAGAIGTPIYPTLTPSQAAYILKDSGARVMFVSDRAKFNEIETVLAECPALEHVVLFESDKPTGSKLLTLEQLQERGREIENQRPELAAELAHAARPEDLATIIYTSGTTGEPKGVMLTHANMVSNLIDSSDHFAFGGKDSALSVLPLSHGFERQAMNMYLYHGMSIYFGESLEKIGVNLREVHPTVLVGVPRIYEKILAKVQDRAAAKSKLNGSLFSWAVEIGKQCAQMASD